MKRIVMTMLLAASIAGCDQLISKGPELQENTEEYFKAHGIVSGQVNELRIGGTLFRFPAGVGLNPYTGQEAIRTRDGSPMTLSQKECLEQGKCERVASPIVKGQADKVSLYLLDDGKGYLPTEHPRGPFYKGATGLFVEIVIGNGYRENVADWRTSTAMKSAVLSQDNSTNIGLKKYVFDNGKNNSDKSLFYVAENLRTPKGGSLVINCKSKYEANNGFVAEPAACSAIYQTPQGFSVAYVFSGEMQLPRWHEVHLAVTSFVDSVIVK
ncbi:MAG: hypothetical protein ABL877_00740 [Thiobacillus sp.]